MTGLTARLSYFKRYKMEAALQPLPAPTLPDGFTFASWTRDLLDAHADALFESFHEEIDAKIFPSLGDRAGSRTLMTAIVRKRGFLPEATWLIVGPEGPCATVQGVWERGGVGAIQNLGVTPLRRGIGLGRALLVQALRSFHAAGLNRALLEVTAQNDAAISLYRSLGFLRCKTIYKAVAESTCPL
jgi:ribosomal protein S18 acetylase RimI-like enzyme